MVKYTFFQFHQKVLITYKSFHIRLYHQTKAILMTRELLLLWPVQVLWETHH